MSEDGYYVLQDPYHPYALELVARIKSRFPQLRPLAYYTNPRLRFYFRKDYDLTQVDPRILEVECDLSQSDEFVEHLRQEFNIIAVLPWNEQVMDHSIELMEKLDLNWNRPELMRCFRQKFALKQLLWQKDASLLPGPSFQVNDLSDFLQLRSQIGECFVIKPVAGYSNQAIGFFNQSSELSDLANYFQSAQQFAPFTVELCLSGPEFAINGQVDAQGQVAIYSIFRYERTNANGRANVYSATWSVASQDPAFAKLSEYASRVVAATGLRRCPFHMEAILDERYGPSLIEVGARMGGGFFMYATNDLHRGQIDVFDIAAHYYISEQPYPQLELDWTQADRLSFLDLDGISNQAGIITDLGRKHEVEQLTEFVRWTTEPVIGQRLQPTVDLESLPWAMHLCSDKGEDHLRVVARNAREMMQFNRNSSLWTLGMVRFRSLTKRIVEKLLWLKRKKPPGLAKQLGQAVWLNQSVELIDSESDTSDSNAA